MPNKKFLEEYSLYKEFEAEDSLTVNQAAYYSGAISGGSISIKKNIARPSINGDCPICKRVQTYNMANDYGKEEYTPAGNIFQIIYKCAGCRCITKQFFVFFFNKKIKEKNEEGKEEEKTKLFMMKVGQYPSWDIDIDKKLEKILGDKSEMYGKGLVCESQSYGIGAYAYYRRITEDIIDELLTSISYLIDDKEKENYKQALEKFSETKVASEKIELVKDLLPSSLRPEGINPLDVLHSSLSFGLHKESDEKCLEIAEDIKSVLIFLVNKVAEHKEDSKNFTDKMRKLLNKKANNKKK